MARPIRDFETGTASGGDPVRSLTRFSDGYDWIESGQRALQQAGGDLARAIQDRVEKTNRLEDAASRAKAAAALRLGVDERLRRLDPRSERYTEEVETAFSETLQGVLDTTNFRRSEVREQFQTDSQTIRVQALLSAADTRERAVVQEAKDQYDIALNKATAAIAAAPNSRAFVLANMEAEIGPILANVRPEVRDELTRQAIQVTANEQVRALITQRDFSGARAALADYGKEGLLPPAAVRQIRSALESEQRQAAAEANTRRTEAYTSVTLSIQEGDLAGARSQIEDMLKAGLLQPGSPAARRLNIALERAEYQARDRGAEIIAAAEADMAVGRPLTPTAEGDFVTGMIRREVENARAQVPENAPEEVRQQALSEAAVRGRDRAVERMLQAFPASVPAALRQQADAVAARGTPAQRAAFAAKMLRWSTLAPQAVEEVMAADDAALSVIEDLRDSGQPITEAAIAQGLQVAANIPPEARKVRDDEWKTQTTGRDATVNPTRLLDDALAGVLPGDVDGSMIDPRVRAQAQARMREAFLRGASPEQAAARAAQWIARTHTISRAGTRPVQVPAATAPINHIPSGLRASYGDASIEEAIRDKAIESLRASLGDAVREYEVLVTAVGGRGSPVSLRALVRHQDDRTGIWRQVPADGGRPWSYVLTGKDEPTLETELGLEQRRQDEIKRQRVVVPEALGSAAEAPADRFGVGAMPEAPERAVSSTARVRDLERQLETARRNALTTGGNWSAARVRAHRERWQAEAERLQAEIERLQ